MRTLVNGLSLCRLSVLPPDYAALPARGPPSTVLVQDSEFYDARVKLADLSEASVRVRNTDQRSRGAFAAKDIFDAITSNPAIEKKMVPTGMCGWSAGRREG